MHDDDLHVPAARKGTTLVILSGLATSLLALGASWLLGMAFPAFNPMGFYVWFVAPVGAILVGLLAGSGYLLAAWLRGVRLSGAMLLVIILLQLTAYFQIQYLDYQMYDPRFEDGQPVGFVEYFDAMTRAFSFQDKQGKQGAEVGAWGYLFRALEIAGFCLGSVLVILNLSNAPFCETCQLYRRRTKQFTLPAGVERESRKRSTVAGRKEYKQEIKQAFEDGIAVLEQVVQAASEEDSETYRQYVNEHRPHSKAYDKLTSSLTLEIVHCPRCHDGYLEASTMVQQGDNSVKQVLVQAPLTPEFIAAHAARND